MRAYSLFSEKNYSYELTISVACRNRNKLDASKQSKSDNTLSIISLILSKVYLQLLSEYFDVKMIFS